MTDLTPYLSQIAHLPFEQQKELLKLVEQLEFSMKKDAATSSFLGFVKYMWPSFIEGQHHKQMARLFDDVIEGRKKRVIINMPPRHTKPLKTNVKITMADGSIKELGDVSVGDFVLTHKGRGRRVLAVHKQGVIGTIDVHTASGLKIGAAPSHPFLTERGWVNAGDLLPTDILVTVPQTASRGGDLFRAYLAGYLVGDGSIGWARNGKAQKASMTVADDIELSHITSICDKMGIVLNKGSSKYEWHLSGGYEKRATGTMNTYVRTDDFCVREWLRDEGMVKSSADKRVPDFIMRGTRDEIAAFLGSYFACDGTVANRRGRYNGCAIGFTTISEGLANDVHALLWRIGLKFRLKKETSQIVYKGERKFKDCWKLHCTDRSVAAAFFEAIGEHIFHEKKDRLIREIADAEPIYHNGDKLSTLTATEDCECICLEVDEDHTFIAGNVVVHNSEFASIHLPAYFLGRAPDKKIIMASHTSELAVGFGRKVRALVDRKDFQQIFPGVQLSADSKAAGRWATNHGGEYFAVGVGGALAGKGADLAIIDDPVSENDALLGEYNPEIYQKQLEWYEGGPRQRLQPGGAIIVVMTRWSKRDLTGQLLKKQMDGGNGDTWEVIELPAIFPETGNPLWPEYWKLEELLKTKASISISKWNAQYMQNPTSEEGALIKRDHWMDWPNSKPPKCDVVVQSWDTAFTTGTRSDYSACTTWGVFYNELTEKNAIILLDAERGKWEFPGLKRKAKELYEKHQPDICLIEGRATGQPLIYELRAMGLPVQEVTVGRGTVGNGNDKISRVNSVTDVFASQNVYAPRHKRWAQEVIEECAQFPAGEHDDFLDTVVMAMSRFRQGGWLINENDEWDDEVMRRKRNYY